ncbi:MAG: hypothetical protein WCE90_00635 [Candidatus Zixiibacteriota bacterium]
MSVKKVLWLLFMLLCILMSMENGANLAQAEGVRKSDQLGTPPKLEAKLILYKNQYLLREPIWIKVQVTNVGSEPGKFEFVNIDGLTIKDTIGTIYPCKFAIDRFPVNINPGQTFEEQFNILTSYGVKEDTFWVRFYLPPEKYQVYYQVEDGVRSESFSFSIMEPGGDEIKAMNLLKESYDLQIQKKDKESLGKLKELIRVYPKSQYYVYALLLSAGGLEDWYDLIQRFPDSREAIQAIGSIALTYEYKKDKQGFIDAMNSLIQKYPNTDIAKEAKDRLNRMDDKYFR